jgi:hypothetical protein
MLFSAVYSLAPLAVDIKTGLYFWIWIYCQPIEWACRWFTSYAG